jgi:hypothetical protein
LVVGIQDMGVAEQCGAVDVTRGLEHHQRLVAVVLVRCLQGVDAHAAFAGLALAIL